MGKTIPRSLASRRLHGVAGRRVAAPRPLPSACPGSLRLLEPQRGCYQFRRPPLALSKVREATQVKYTSLLNRLLGWRHLARLPSWPAARWDEALTQYLEFAFDRGQSIGDTMKPPSALIWAVPRLGGPVRRILPSAHATLQGWQRLVPPTSRPRLP